MTDNSPTKTPGNSIIIIQKGDQMFKFFGKNSPRKRFTDFSRQDAKPLFIHPITKIFFAATFEIIASQPITNANFGQMVLDTKTGKEQPSSLSYSMKTIYKNKGFRGYYAGIPATLLSKGAGKFMKLTFFDEAYKKLNADNQHLF